MKKIYLCITIIIAGLLFCVGSVYIIHKTALKNHFTKEDYKDSDLEVVLSLEDDIETDSVWCGTFNLVWNDLKEQYVKQDIIFDEPIASVNNLNKGTFNKNYLNADSYYIKNGYQTYKLKEEIEQNIKEKFNEESDILNDFEWEEESQNIFLYAMLKKEFKFETAFTKLSNGKFNNYNNVKYFGIDGTTKDKVRKQVEVLYYVSDDEFAIKLLTKDNDEVILVKGNPNKSFLSIYNDVITKSSTNLDVTLGENDFVKIPYIDFKIKEEFKELENKTFTFSNNKEYYISKAMQTINFSLNEQGGKIKSEAGIGVNESASLAETPRYLYLDDTFVIFLKEKDKDLPYFGAKISNISNVQDDVKLN